MAGWTNAGSTPLGEGERRDIGAATVVRVEGRLVAFASRCPHMGHPLDDARIVGHFVVCGWHRYEFDLRSGQCVQWDCADLPTFPVRVRDGVIQVQLPEPA